MSLRDVTLFSMFGSLQQVNYANYIKDTISTAPKSGDVSITNKLNAWIDEVVLLEDSSFLKAFHLIHYLFNLEGIENNSIKDDAIFQDFASVLSM